MNPATPQGIKAPAGGFQNGGWYWDANAGAARQYMNGSFGAPNTISNPNQQGYGQQVSPTVQRQSNPNAAPVNAAPATPVDQAAATIAGNNQGGLSSFMNQNGTPDLLGIYGATNPDIQNIEEEIGQAQTAQANTAGMINENPFYSEAIRTGKLENMFNMSNQKIGVLQNQLALKQADQQRAIDIARGQFDINSQAKEQALNQFNTLLQTGALTNASGQDVANIAQLTGLSTDMVQNAISRQGVNVEKLGPDNEGNYTFVVTKNGIPIQTEKIAGAGVAQKPTVVPNAGLAPGQVLIQNPDGSFQVTNTQALGGQPGPTKVGDVTYQYDPATGQYIPYQGQGGLLHGIMSTLFGPQTLTPPGVGINGSAAVTPTAGESATLQKLTVKPPKVTAPTKSSGTKATSVKDLKLQF